MAAPDLPRPTSVYRAYDANGFLLYIGITSRGRARNHEHAESSPWWPHVASQKIEHYPTREEAEAVEAALIRAQRPPYNTVHNHDPDRGALRAAHAGTTWTRHGVAAPRVAGFHKYRVPLRPYRLRDGLLTMYAPTELAAHLERTTVGADGALFDAGGLKAGVIEGIAKIGPVPCVHVRITDAGAYTDAAEYVGRLKPRLGGEVTTYRLTAIRRAPRQ